MNRIWKIDGKYSTSDLLTEKIPPVPHYVNMYIKKKKRSRESTHDKMGYFEKLPSE